MLKNTESGYGLPARMLHWVVFLLLLGAIIGGRDAAHMADGPERTAAILEHKSFGVLILALVMLRLAWRLFNTVPKPLGSKLWEVRLALAMHWALYILMFAQPVSGVLMSQYHGYGVSFFGLFELPTLVGEDKAVGEVLHTMHGVIWLLLSMAAVIHGAAALKHHFVDKDRTLVRMLKG